MHPVTQLRQYDEQFRALARGLPGGKVDAGAVWRAIGFRVSGVQLAASMEQVREILTEPQVSRVPGSRPWVKGLANVRGRLVTVVDLPQFLRMDRDGASNRTASRALYVEQGDLAVGLLVDEVYGARQFPEDGRVSDLGETADALRPYATGRMINNADAWLVVDVGRILSDPSFLNAAA
ncbi:MAG: chemotaxis protein CheW [Pseudomonadota bacterium]